MRRRHLPRAAALVLVAILGASGCETESSSSLGDAPSAEPPSLSSDSALSLLGDLRVKGRGPKTGYSREQYGQAWADTNRNGCDTRNDILKRDLTEVTLKPGTDGCVILTGTLADPYTRKTIPFVRGGSSEVDVDHVVALGNSWSTGAAPWPFRKRLAFANDPLNLLVVVASANQQKSAGDAATWLPANRPYRCAYVARQVAVKTKYQLWVTPAERDAIVRVLRTCPSERAPTSSEPTIAPINPPAPSTARASSPDTGSPDTAPPDPGPMGSTPPEASAKAVEVYYKNCGAARDAGAAPMKRGAPGYRSGLDRDDDGLACE